MVAQPHRQYMSVAEYLTLDRESGETRYEYVDGYATMMSGGSLNHSAICINITSLLRNRLHGSRCRVYNSDARVRISATRYFYPDATVSCNERDQGTGDTIVAPRVIIEVLSPGNATYDRGDKFIYYRSCPTIEEYVLVDTERQAVDIYRRASDTLWTLHLFGPGDQVRLACLDISFPISTLYEGVTLPEASGEPTDGSPA